MNIIYKIFFTFNVANDVGIRFCFFLALSGSTRYKTSKYSASDDSFSNLNYLGIFGAFHSNKHSGSDIGL